MIFTSWTQIGSGQTGKLHILDYLGNPLYEVPLPAAWDGSDWNGGMPAPTLADIDGDPDLEVVVNTAHTGLVAYDLPGTANARILWGTGRGNYQRSASILQGNLNGSTIMSDHIQASPGDTVTYIITLRNPGPTLENVSLTDVLPPTTSYAGQLTASSGTAGESGGVITWEGDVPASAPVTIQFDITLDTGQTAPHLVTNTALIDDGLGNVLHRQAVISVNGYVSFLPQVEVSFLLNQELAGIVHPHP